jgi:hypothetical protein
MKKSAPIVEIEQMNKKLETALDEYFVLMDKPKNTRAKEDIIKKRRIIGKIQAEIIRISKI